MYEARDFRDSRVLLAPFNDTSVLFCESLRNDGVDVIGFLDQNPFLHGKEYDDGIFVQRQSYFSGTKVILCAHENNDAIRQRLIELGYDDKDILLQKTILTATSPYEAAGRLDLEHLKSLFPLQHMSGEQWMKLRKYQRLQELGAPKPWLRFEDFDGEFAQETYIDSRGGGHSSFFAAA